MAAANLPFVNDRLFAMLPFKSAAGDRRVAGRRKPLFVRLLEMFVLYLLVGAAGFALEARIGNAFPPTWAFYAITGCLFIVLAFPGFVVRYLRKHPG